MSDTSTNPPRDPTFTGRAPHIEQRVSTLIGDRLCAKCGYNLTGQAILREPHYHMMIVRCPECATVAALQEYPLLGRWANRWAMVLAGLWLILIMGLLVGTGAAIFGFSMGIAEEGSGQYANVMSQQYTQWQQEQVAAAAANPAPNTTTGAAGASNVNVVVNRWSITDYNSWRDQQDFSAMFEQAGGWRGAVNWLVLLIGIPFALTIFAMGCFWSVALLGLQWRSRLVVFALVMAIAMTFAAFVIVDWFSDRYMMFWIDARRQIGPPLLIGSLLFGGLSLLTGMWLGRRIVRAMVRVLLPPRLRQSLAMLWTSDGLPPPSCGRR